ncbi:AraC family transcriptional regulator [Pseudomonas sp. S3E17]|uniref:AraC family transcriptional regulator n=1 Tax=Pseudomonas sp. S3E17 TaxID=2817893 RepID=UPI00209F9BC8|nr:AraC family transcriptional regulator [Pseudomonas sp. S3E17]MCP1463274.1 AraC-like DNA-binding protein [Pseudomonas sp. S3E17]
MSSPNAYESLRIIHRPGVGSAGIVLQQESLEFKRLYIESPVFIYVERGSKTVRWSGGEYVINPGEAIAVAGGLSLDIINRLAQDGSYQAHWLVLDEALIQSYAEANMHLAAIRYAQPITCDGEHFAESFERAVEAVKDTTIPNLVARHRVQELLVWAGVQGVRFEQPCLPTMAFKVRQLIASDLANEWSALDIASTFALSEATLRRRLAEEGTTFSRLLIDARMTFALQLLQSSAQTVMQIALCVGYQTPSQFAVRFRDRFGFAPTAIRGHRR